MRIIDMLDDDLLSDVGSDDGQQLIGAMRPSAQIGLITYRATAEDKESS